MAASHQLFFINRDWAFAFDPYQWILQQRVDGRWTDRWFVLNRAGIERCLRRSSIRPTKAGRAAVDALPVTFRAWIWQEDAMDKQAASRLPRRARSPESRRTSARKAAGSAGRGSDKSAISAHRSVRATGQNTLAAG